MYKYKHTLLLVLFVKTIVMCDYLSPTPKDYYDAIIRTAARKMRILIIYITQKISLTLRWVLKKNKTHYVIM